MCRRNIARVYRNAIGTLAPICAEGMSREYIHSDVRRNIDTIGTMLQGGMLYTNIAKLCHESQCWYQWTRRRFGLKKDLDAQNSSKLERVERSKLWTTHSRARQLHIEDVRCLRQLLDEVERSRRLLTLVANVCRQNVCMHR